MAKVEKNRAENDSLLTAAASVPADVIAAISGAVAFICGESATVSSIKPRREVAIGRSAWKMAGLLDNTRPF